MCFFFNKIGTLQAGHQTPSKRGAVGGKHQRILQWPGGRLYFLLNFVHFPIISAYESFIWWECYKEATLTLVGPTSTSSPTEPGLIKIKTLTDKDKTYVHLTVICASLFRIIDYTDPYDIEYACFMISKPPPLPQWQAFTTPLQPPVCSQPAHLPVLFSTFNKFASPGLACHLAVICDCHSDLCPADQTGGLGQGPKIWFCR